MRNESGQTLVLVALSLVAIFGIASLAVDGGMAYAERRRMQTAADAGALGGASILMTQGEHAARAWAAELANANGAAIAAEDVVIENLDGGAVTPDTTLTVNTYEDADTSLARVIGNNVVGVAASATAAFSPLGGTLDLLPIAVLEPEDMWEPGDRVALLEREEDKDSVFMPGNFGWLITGKGHPGSQDTLTGELLGTISSSYFQIGDWIEGMSGGKSFPSVQGIMESHWYGEDGTVIIFDVTDGPGANCLYHIVGFARFEIEIYEKYGDIPEDIKDELIHDVVKNQTPVVVGTFVEMVTVSGTGGGPDYGAYTAYLIR